MPPVEFSGRGFDSRHLHLNHFSPVDAPSRSGGASPYLASMPLSVLPPKGVEGCHTDRLGPIPMSALAVNSELPDLRIVPIEGLVFHERHDSRRIPPLLERLRQDGVLKNPPIVAPIPGSHRFVVLDGANRTVALAQMGCPHILVQVVDYQHPRLRLNVWYHLVTGISGEEFDRRVRSIPGLEVLSTRDLLTARAALARRYILAYAVRPDGMILMFRGGGDDIVRQSELLNALVDVYEGRADIYRIGTDRMEEVAPLYGEVAALVVFPHYHPSEILDLTRREARLPTGITRHVIPGRALRLHFPLDLLADTEQSLEEKNRWLQGWLKQKFVTGQVRFYEESTFLFDE